MKKEECMTNQTAKETTQKDRGAERLNKKSRRKVDLFCAATMTHYGSECDFMSLMIVADDGNVFYAQFTDYNVYRVDDPAVKENELLFGVDETKTCADVRETLGIKPDDKKSCVCLGSKEDVRKLLLTWLNDIYGDCAVTVVSGFTSGLYALTGLCDLFGGLRLLPACIRRGGYHVISDNEFTESTVEQALEALKQELTQSQMSSLDFSAANFYKYIWQH